MSDQLVCNMGTSPPQPIDSTDATSRVECLNMGGEIGVVSSDPNPPRRGCFIRDVLTRSLGEQILELGGSYGVACYFRDHLLSKSPHGQRLLQNYYDGLPRTFLVVGNDPNILFEAIKTWRSLSTLATTIARLHSGELVGKDAGKATYTSRRHAQVRRFFAIIRHATDDQKYLAGLQEIEDELARYVGRNSRSILEGLLTMKSRT